MRVLIAGGSGFVGRALVARLKCEGHEVRRLVRRETTSPDDYRWQPESASIDPKAIAWAEGIVNLAGHNVAEGRWTERRRALVRESRIEATKTLVKAIEEERGSGSGTTLRVLINASAVGYYGSCGDEVLDEEAPCGAGFLAEVCRDWEAAAVKAEASSIRVVRLRIGMVLGVGGGALERLLPPFRLGLGGRLGDGKAWMSWIALEDLLSLIQRALMDSQWRGAVNAVAPDPVTNEVFTRTLAGVLRRPALLPVPRWLLRTGFGEMADAVLLASTRAVPRRVLELGFEFHQRELKQALAEAAGEKQ